MLPLAGPSKASRSLHRSSRSSRPIRHRRARAALKATTGQSPCLKRRTSPTRRPGSRPGCTQGQESCRSSATTPFASMFLKSLSTWAFCLRRQDSLFPNLKPANFTRLRKRRRAEGHRLQARRSAHHRAPALRICIDKLLLHLRHAQCRVGLCAAVEAAGLRGHDDLRHAHANCHRLYPGQDASSTTP